VIRFILGLSLALPVRLASAAFAVSAVALALPAADWSQFKGPNATGVSAEKDLPVKWGKDAGVKWKTKLPARGVSSPVVAGDRVYVTCSSGNRDDRLHVLCFDAATGRQLWHRTLQATGGTGCHPKSCMAAPTPVADETGVYALFATADVAAFDKDGSLRWYRSLVGDYPTITNQVGMAASPVLVKDRLIVPMDNSGESFLAAVDTKYGKNVWKAERPREINWVTPLVRTVGDKTEVLFDGPTGLTSYDAETGEKRWAYKGSRGSIPTAALDGDTLYMPVGGTTAVRLGPGGVVGDPQWKSNGVQSGMASPLAYAGKVFATSGQGFISCADAKTGKELYKERTKGAYSASAVAGDGKVYCTNETGITTVLDAKSDTFEVLATNDIGEEVLGTPAIANGCLFIRTDKHLWCVGK
jgi:outer membrane protein assembly factor BamB